MSLESPFNMNYTFGNDLREKPEDINAFTEGIAHLEKHLKFAKTDLEKARQLSKIGVLNRIIGNTKVSLEQLKSAQTILKAFQTERISFVNEIRIAQTLQYLGQFIKAEQLYNRLKSIIEEQKQHEDLLSFIHQHKGKNYYEQGRLEEALNEIEKALKLRELKGDVALIKSSRFALTRVRAAIQAG